MRFVSSPRSPRGVWRAGSRPGGRGLAAIACASVLLAAPLARAELIGEVDTAFRWLGKDDRVVVEAYDDPKVKGVTCYVSRARTGGVKGTVGLAEDKSEASIACRQVTPRVEFVGPLVQQEDVFTERMSLVFKRLHVVRIVDRQRNALVYLTYSDRLIDGSPTNGVTAVPVSPETPIPVK
ncbi:MAG: CreA family protein [Burkholderiaceae bacterium]